MKAGFAVFTRFWAQKRIENIRQALVRVHYYYKYLKSQESIKNDDLGVHQHDTPLQIEKTEIITDVTKVTTPGIYNFRGCDPQIFARKYYFRLANVG